MKKISLYPAAALFGVVAVVLFLSCQKEQNSVSTDATAAASSENTHIVSVAGAGGYAGSINTTYAAALAANYAKKYGNDNKQTQSVAFSAKDLISFINSLQTKYKSDIIYVNFGIYGQGAKPLDLKDWNRLTVFFTGNKIPAPSGNRRSDDVDTGDGSDQFLNHGSIFP